MKYLRQFLIIILISFLGEVLRAVLPFPIPASIYGTVLMFLALLTGVIKLSQVRDTAKFLVEIMPIMFIPACVGIMATWDKVQPIIVPLAVIVIVSTIVVMGVSAKVTELVIGNKGKEAEDDN